MPNALGMEVGGYIKVSRAKLYELVWQYPLECLNKKIPLSDVGIAKLCKRNQIRGLPKAIPNGGVTSTYLVSAKWGGLQLVATESYRCAFRNEWKAD